MIYAVSQHPTPAQKDLALGLMLCCGCPEILSNFQTMGLHLPFALDLLNSVASPAPNSPISSPTGCFAVGQT